VRPASGIETRGATIAAERAATTREKREQVKEILNPLVSRNAHGAYVVSDIVGGYWVTEQFYGYSKREAVRLFRIKHDRNYRPRVSA
jgi:hypothetical protein